MILIGDVHGLFDNYRGFLRLCQCKKSLQLGDFGLGFPMGTDHVDMSDIPGKHLFLRGNHDNPAVCRKDKNYVGDFGVLKGSFINGRFKKLFYISGAWSIDKAYRTPGLTWWEDEQLSIEELNKAVDLYRAEKPDIVCSHDCPTGILTELYKGTRGHIIPTRTGQAMDEMINIHKPNYFFFAHHHVSWRKNIGGCCFICLDELETLDISKRIHPEVSVWER